MGWLVLLLLLTGCQQVGDYDSINSPSPAHPSFVTRQELADALGSAKPEPVEIRGHQVSGVVPHHLVAGHLIADYFAGLSRQSPEVIIIVGPNHENRGGKIITGFYNWQIPGGTVKTEKEVVASLLELNLAVQDEAVLAGEHSIGTLVPFVRHYLPEAKIVPIILHHGVTLDEVDKLLNGMEPYLNDKTVLAASVDFSHYLTSREAENKDTQTLIYMRNFDYAALFRLGDDHLDSPASLALAFRHAQKQGIKEFQVLEHTNSGVIMNNQLMETTSYFTLVFARG
ncbi:MAG: AmmeMemoRadiSam system protein B [Syntrophomonadaceae bacterium]|nr:AmmeMemoRadiSam system protein B [Syntrophomonadaceae bacterium]